MGSAVPPLYLDACATSPPAPAVLEAMAEVDRNAWANPSSLHGFGLAAADVLERSRLRLAHLLGCDSEELLFSSGGSESIHLALLGVAASLPAGRLLISAVEHPATVAAADQLHRRGWEVCQLPVNALGQVEAAALEPLLAPPTRLVSVIWGQSEVGTVQDIGTIGALCRAAGVLLHLDAVQVVGHRAIDFSALPVDLLSFTAHKLQGPRGIGALLVRRGVTIQPLIGGGGQERGRRGGTEPVALAAGMARALELAQERLEAGGGCDPLMQLRDDLLAALLALDGVHLSGPDPRRGEPRLPHHLSLLITDRAGKPLEGRRLVRELWREGIACSSGSACSAIQPTPAHAPAGGASPVLLAMGLPPDWAASGLRLSLGPWLKGRELERVPAALERARTRMEG
jgi:cysteine desulfurase